jgi:hypothetical protein
MDLLAGQHRKYGQSAFGADEGESRFPREDIKPVLSSRLFNIAQTRLDMGPSLGPVRRVQSPLRNPNAWPTPAAIAAAGVTMAAACQS